MKQETTIFSVNGVAKDLPPEAASSFGDLMEFIRTNYISDASCISSIRIDGLEISEKEEKAFALLPLSEIRSVEIFTAHPRELAEETLQNLRVFSQHLSMLSQNAGILFRVSGHPSQQFAKLMDGIQTFTEALTGVKQILRAADIQEIRLLETDLLSMMKDLLDFYQREQIEFAVDLLCEHLPRNLEEWRNKGIPALIKARDS